MLLLAAKSIYYLKRMSLCVCVFGWWGGGSHEHEPQTNQIRMFLSAWVLHAACWKFQNLPSLWWIVKLERLHVRLCLSQRPEECVSEATELCKESIFQRRVYSQRNSKSNQNVISDRLNVYLWNILKYSPAFQGFWQLWVCTSKTLCRIKFPASNTQMIFLTAPCVHHLSSQLRGKLHPSFLPTSFPALLFRKYALKKKQFSKSFVMSLGETPRSVVTSHSQNHLR